MNQTKESITQIEMKCTTLTFINATAGCVHLRQELVSYPSKIIQARLEFDAIVQLDNFLIKIQNKLRP